MKTSDRLPFLIENLFKLTKQDQSGIAVEEIKYSRDSKHETVSVVIGNFIRRKASPDHPWLVYMGAGDSNERLFTSDLSQLVCEPAKILKGGFECYSLSGITFKWFKVQSTESKYIKPLIAPFAKNIYEIHHRTMSFGGSDEYIKSLSAYHGRKHTSIMHEGHPLLAGDEACDLMCSIKEDMHRQGVFHVKLTSEETSLGIRMSVDYDAVKELFSHRNSPLTETGRKKPIIHWVSKHLRRTHKFDTQVDRHIRGIEKFTVNGYLIEISQPEILLHQF